MIQVVLGALLIGAGVFTVIVSSRARRERNVRNLRQVLDIVMEEGSEDASPHELSSLLARAGTYAERAIQGTGLSSRIVERVDRSDWAIGPGEFLAVSMMAGLGGLAFGLLASSPVLAGILGAGGALAPLIYVDRSVSRRRSRFEAQFPDVLDLIAASLASGASMSQAIELVVAEADDPVASEFGKVLSSTRLGQPLVEALKSMAERIGSRDLDWTVQAIVVQQRTGGKLADILHTVADFMRGREEVRRELRALTAEGRLSAYILGGLPFAMAAIISVVSPGYLSALFTTTPGLVMVIGSSILLVLGFIVMSRIVKVEV